MEEQLKKIRECLVAMMDVMPNPAVAIVTRKDEKKPKHEEAEVENGQK